MALLDDIRNGVLDDSTSLATVLRRCKLLASRIKYEPLTTWADLELNGYRGEIDIPEYRKIPVSLHASGANVAWRVTGQAIPAYILPENLQEAATSTFLTQDVSSLETVQGKENLRFDASPALHHWVEHEGGGNLTITSVYLDIPPGAITGVLSAIRSKILDFILVIEGEFPDLQDKQITTDPIVRETVKEAFQVGIYGGNPILNIGSDVSIQQDNRQVVVSDLNSLHTYLEAQGFDPSDFSELDEAIADPVAIEEIKEGRGRIATWASEASKQITSKTGSVLYKTATEVAIKAALAYLGLG